MEQKELIDFYGAEDEHSNNAEHRKYLPLAERMRPKSFAELLGQEKLSKDGSFIKWLKNGGRGNVLLYGPPGCGKTTLAQLIAQETNSKIIKLNAVLSNLSELKAKLQAAANSNSCTWLFIDEIHRFNRAQQDSLLPYCESGKVKILGATTRHPAFYLIPALISRSHLFEINPLAEKDLINLLQKATEDQKTGMGAHKCTCEKDCLRWIAKISKGDARRALNILEYLILGLPLGSNLSLEYAKNNLHAYNQTYDAKENDHYDIISAFIKSMRGCDADSTVYWLARLLEGGEDPLYIARRMVIFASEDVGLSAPEALNSATAAYKACEVIGMPEVGIVLSQVSILLALSPKSNSTYLAWKKASASVKSGNQQEVPDYLKEKPLNASAKYLYAHDFSENITGQKLRHKEDKFYNPKWIGAEYQLAKKYSKFQNRKKLTSHNKS